MVNRILVTAVLILIQVVWIFFQMEKLAGYSNLVSNGFKILSILVVLYIIGKDDNSAYKIKKMKLTFTDSKAISNDILERIVQIDVHKGGVLVVQSKEKSNE